MLKIIFFLFYCKYSAREAVLKKHLEQHENVWDFVNDIKTTTSSQAKISRIANILRKYILLFYSESV